MSLHSRLASAGSGTVDERAGALSSNAAQTSTYKLAGGYRDEIYGNGIGHSPVPKHRRVISASDISLKRLRDGEILEQPSRDESIPELFLGEPLEDMDEAERRTLQTQWADALQKVQSLRSSGAGTQSERWSGVATDIFRPKPFSTLQDSAQHASGARISHVPPVPTPSLDHWNYYPGPSAHRDTDNIPHDHTIRENKNVGASAGAWNRSLLGETLSNREGKKFGRDSTSHMLKGRGSKSITTFEKLDPSREATQSVIGEENMVTEQGHRGSTGKRGANRRSRVMDQTPNGFSSTAPSLDQLGPRPKSYSSAVASQVQRTQSQRYGRIWGQKPQGIHVQDMRDTASGVLHNAPLPSPILKKAISMREGGAHADAVLEMARAYTDTVCGVPKTLECASCGRNLGVIVQGNPGVDVAFCQPCRPSPAQWKKAVSDDAAGSKKKKNAIMRFCRKILRLDKKSS